MEIEWADVRIGDKQSMEMEMIYWLQVVDWMGDIQGMPDTPPMPAGAKKICQAVTEMITTDAFRMAYDLEHAEKIAEARKQHPIMQILQQFGRDDDE